MVVKISTAAMSKNRRFYEEAHLSFSGGGFLGIYHVGVALAFRDFAPHVANRKVFGTSAGALAASCLVSGFPMDKAINNIVTLAVHCRSLPLGPLHPRFNLFDTMRRDLDLYMPADAHIRSSGKLFVSVTRASNLQNELISNFDSRQELIDVLMASCFIPYFLGWVPPKVKGVSYIDGGISRNLPIHDEHTITVSPFPGESRIGPRSGNLPKVAFMPETLLRLCKTVYAPSPSILEELIQQGYKDAVHFLQNNDMISCHSCIAAENYFITSSGPSSSMKISHSQQENDSEQLSSLIITDRSIDGKDCEHCDAHIKLSSTSNVSRTLLRPLELATIEEQLERQLRPYRHTRLARTVALVVAIVMLPFDIALATIGKAARSWGYMWDCILHSYSGLSAPLRKIVVDSQEKGCQVCGGPGAIAAESSTASSSSNHVQSDCKADGDEVDNVKHKPVSTDRKCANCVKGQ
ncbi:patanin-like phospholipase domain-containing protein [Varroa jacobsoni]|uniref:patanin-like phospholipase domain-containing protein n=1 Tax=Varroa jacobsoni TaxID=62625 RepID=UPI000BF56F6E|nr:patanin-like phospholipase domain-containing protein [Varroa jacobsoni]